MSKPKHDYSAAIEAYKANPAIADGFPHTLRTLLRLHFIENMRWSDVAEEMNYCIENIYRLRPIALGRVEDIINDRETAEHPQADRCVSVR